MTAPVEGQIQAGKLDVLKWGCVLVLIAAAIVGFYYFGEQKIWIRIAGLLVVTGVAVAIALRTAHGQAVFAFAKEARTEVRKVVWPSPQETRQTTLIIAAFVVVMSLILWGVDAILVRLIGWITGQGA